MSLIRRAIASPERRSAGEWGDSTPPPPGGGNTNGPISELQALQIMAVYGSMQVICNGLASFPWQRFSSPDPARRRLLPLTQLLKNPYVEIRRTDWIKQYGMSMGLRGNFYGQVLERDEDFNPSQIKPIHPDRARVRRLPNGRPEYRFNGQVVPLDNVFHVRYQSVPGSLVGLNPIEIVRSGFGIARAQEAYAAAYLNNSANPEGVIEVEDDLDDDETLALARGWMATHQGVSKAHLPAVLTGGAKFNAISVNPRDSQFLESRQYSATTISGMIFLVPPHMIGIVDRSTSWGCLPGDSMVYTMSGPKPIEDVLAGEEVWSLEEGAGMTPAKVTAWQMTGYRKLLHVHTTGRTLRATDNHRVPVRRYVGIKQGAAVGACRWENVWVRADEIKIGDYLMVPHGLTPGANTTAPNGRELTAAAMEFCGMFIGDGSMDKNRVEIAHEREPDHMRHYSQVIRNEFGAEPYVDKRGTRTRFSSVAAIELLGCGFTGTALTKRVPGWVFALTPELQLAFLRGYLDADGSVQRGRIIYSSAHKALLEDVRHLCIGLGVPTGRVCLGRKGGPMTIAGRTYISQPKYQLSLSSLPHNGRIGSNSPRKASRLTSTPHERASRYDADWCIGPTKALALSQNPGIGWNYKDIRLQRVTRIETGEVEVPVYDITVTGTASFIADGVLVHNTGIEQQERGYVTNCLGGYIDPLEEAIEECQAGDEYVRLDLSKRLRGDRLQRAQAAALELGAGWKSPDEQRNDEDMAPIPDGQGKNFFVPINSELLAQALQSIKDSETAAQADAANQQGGGADA